MRLRHFDHLRSFCIVARHASITDAATSLNLTKGAVSHQIDRLEEELGFPLLIRGRRGIDLTEHGERLLRVAEVAFASMEQEVSRLRHLQQTNITIGMATYFASRWLSPRLMRFITQHDDIGLRIQPIIGNPDLQASQLDMAIRWGRGDWHEPDLVIEKIFSCPAKPACSSEWAGLIEAEGIESVLPRVNLLHDADDSSAWNDWFEKAGLVIPDKSDGLMIPDPNVRVQAVIDGQGIALYDNLVRDEVEKGRIYLYEPLQLEAYGYYLLYPKNLEQDSPIRVFRDWIIAEADRSPAAA